MQSRASRGSRAETVGIREDETVFRKGIAMIGIAAAGVVGASALAGSAHAEQRVAGNCWSISPNIVDVPYNGGATVRTDPARPGIISVTGDSKSIFGYSTDLRIDWRNLDNGRTGTLATTYRNSLADTNGFWFHNVDTGTGRVAFTLSATTRGLLTLPAPTCTGEALV